MSVIDENRARRGPNVWRIVEQRLQHWRFNNEESIDKLILIHANCPDEEWQKNEEWQKLTLANFEYIGSYCGWAKEDVVRCTRCKHRVPDEMVTVALIFQAKILDSSFTTGPRLLYQREDKVMYEHEDISAG
jgi:hypothetical protein